MLSEYAVDQWTVAVDQIEKRVGRYEKKAELKRLYKGKSSSECLSQSEKMSSQTSSLDELSINTNIPNRKEQHKSSLSKSFVTIHGPKSAGVSLPERILSSIKTFRHRSAPDTESESESEYIEGYHA